MTLDPSLKQKLDQIVASDAVVLFMKGTKSFPQCGFSASVVTMLNTLIPKYTTVNVLSDPDIRNGMKEYSDWPTFPQLFIRGEFVGGADIVRQMFEAGELEVKLSDLVAPMTGVAISVSEQATAALTAALKDGAPGDVVHLAITPSWEHQLDLGPKQANLVTVESGNLTFQLDRASAARANGIRIDFVDDAAGAGFKIDNPNRPPMVREIEPKQLKALLDAGTLTHLYDVRTAQERSVATIGDTPIFDDAAMAAIEKLPKDTAIAFYCHRGNRSRGAAEHFVKAGFKTVYNLTGGIDAWSQVVDPSVKRY